jgi:ribosomal RNA assembly protein
MQYIKIPKERVAVLIGSQASTKKQIERLLNVQLKIDSSSGEVTIEDNASKDPLSGWKAKDLVIAIGKGFSPKSAFILAEDNMALEIINLRDVLRNQKAIIRQKGRVIGKNGRFRALLEKSLNVKISVYGKYVSIIGNYEDVKFTKEILGRLIKGVPHATILRMIHRHQKKTDFYGKFIKDDISR